MRPRKTAKTFILCESWSKRKDEISAVVENRKYKVRRLPMRSIENIGNKRPGNSDAVDMKMSRYLSAFQNTVSWRLSEEVSRNYAVKEPRSGKHVAVVDKSCQQGTTMSSTMKKCWHHHPTSSEPHRP
jgi:hypothetical protein